MNKPQFTDNELYYIIANLDKNLNVKYNRYYVSICDKISKYLKEKYKNKDIKQEYESNWIVKYY